MDNNLSKDWVKEIRAEYKRLTEDEMTLHNSGMHQRILDTWREGSPKMWANLVKHNLTEELAFVLQERMWNRQKELMKAGYPVTDAREVAEREELMLEPEKGEDENTEEEEHPMIQLYQAMEEGRAMVQLLGKGKAQS